MYEITVAVPLEVAHFYRGVKSCESAVHGHSFEVSATFVCENTDELGMIANPANMKRLLGRCVIDYDHRLMNDSFPFKDGNPTPEALAKRIFDLLANVSFAPTGTSLKISRVTIKTGDVIVSYFDR